MRIRLLHRLKRINKPVNRPERFLPAIFILLFSLLINHTVDAQSLPAGFSQVQVETSGSFTIPNTGETATSIFYRLHLDVTDEQGLSDTAYTDIHPRTSELTFNTIPQGLNIVLDGVLYKTPVTVTSVEGMLRTISAPSPQAFGEGVYYFSNWSQGGEQTQTIITPDIDSSYSAVFMPFNPSVYRNPDNPFNVTNGLNYAYYHGTWSNIPDFSILYKEKAGTVTNFDLSPRSENNNFGFRFSGYVSVPTDGIYTFYTSSDEGSRLYIGDSLIVDNDSMHQAQERSGQIGLKAGLHRVTVDFFENAGGQSLNVSYEGAGISKQFIPDSALFREQPVQYVFNPIADAYVRSGNYININLSAGATPSLITSGDGVAGDEYQTYLRFDISSLGANIASAKLRLYGALTNANPSPVVVDVYNVPNWEGWLEHTITFSNKPPAEGGLLASATFSGTDSGYHEWDLTQLITDLRTSGIYYVSLMLKNISGSDDNLVSFNSRENQTNKPELVVTTNSLITEAKPAPAVQQAIAKTAANSFGPDPSFSVFPNPVSNSFTIKYSPVFGNARLQITGISGSLFKEVMLTESGTQTIRVDNLKEGLYFLSIYHNNKKCSQKILIRR